MSVVGSDVVKVKIQFCWAGGDNYYWRALVCGGLRIRVENPKLEWNRKEASRMLDLLGVELPSVDRSKIRFVHV